ncbi:VIT domain-containing protein [Ottowia testudinis]|uniref:OmpA family protein n=1 Tax=Ottowia testudinis TaxID=2816950 RepID=A0A975CEF9_9BURK|nr:VIT domain-containing protein [Ottowia testudinis]QTD44034.1 OmpA family protein [Ottowia testudinis]
MKSFVQQWIRPLFFLCVCCLAGAAAAQSLTLDRKDDRTLSPYFFVQSDDPSVEQLPLQSTQVDARIAGTIADVTVTQTYANRGQSPIEALYVFPASTRAAVHGMKMTIGERVVEARIEKREDARQQYEQARKEGRSASLLEQQRPNVFQMNLANIMPGDVVKVELRYTELIVPEDGVYAFVYPTVVGPRYSNQPLSQGTANDQWVANPTLRQGEAPTSTLEIQVDLAAGLPVRDVACSTHKTSVAFDGPTAARITLAPEEAHGGNRDFVLRYRLAGQAIQQGLLLYQGQDANYFLLTAQPPKQVTPAVIPGREYVFIVDISGSMHGFPLDVSKELLRNLIGGLRPTDRFNVLLFSGSSAALAEESLPATPENLRRAIDVIDRKQGGGSTELLPAFKHALALKTRKDFARTVVIVTDGYVTVEEEVFDLIRQNLDRTNVFPFGIGSSVNRHLMEGMARVGMGEPFVVAKPEQARAEAERFRKMIASPVLTGVKVMFDGFDAYDVEPAKVPDVLAERPLVVFGKWRGTPQGRIHIKGVSGHGPYHDVVDVARHAPSPSATALPYLWARHRIALLSDYNGIKKDDKRVDEVTRLGLQHHLLTAYTSFVAVDSAVRNTAGVADKVQQPLLLPQGVSNLAVGGASRVYSSAVAAAAPAAAAPVATSKLTYSADAFFAPRQAVLDADGKRKLDDLIAKVKNVNLEVIIVVGHADPHEPAAMAQKLSEDRATAVRDYLVSQGIPAARIHTEGKGAKQPVAGCPPSTPPAQKPACLRDSGAKNRRAELEVVGTRP